MKRTIAVGDIHGCNLTLRKLLIDNLQISEDDTIIFLGDYIDRGPDSPGVINTMLALQEMKYDVHFLRGNHEQMLLDSIGGFTLFSHFINNGGDKTLEAYNLDGLEELPLAHQLFYQSTKLYSVINENIFVHAFLNFKNKNIFEDEEAMLWMRNAEEHIPELGNRLLIHGHTPIALDNLLGQKGNCINLDNGCVFHQKPTLGNLVAYIVEEKRFVVQPFCG